MNSHPWIAASITTSSPVFDLSKQDPFDITVKLNLHNIHPITFDERFTVILDGHLLSEGGLTITNTTTGQKVHRGRLNVCYESSNSDGTPTPDSQDLFITLVSGKEHIVRTSIKPIYAFPDFPTQGLTSAEIDEKNRALVRTSLKWMDVVGLKSGQVYELGISEDAVVRSWMQGSVAGILDAKKALGLRPTIKTSEIKFVVEERPRFEVKRPDEDGSLNWP